MCFRIRSLGDIGKSKVFPIVTFHEASVMGRLAARPLVMKGNRNEPLHTTVEIFLTQGPTRGGSATIFFQTRHIVLHHLLAFPCRKLKLLRSIFRYCRYHNDPTETSHGQERWV